MECCNLQEECHKGGECQLGQGVLQVWQTKAFDDRLSIKIK